MTSLRTTDAVAAHYSPVVTRDVAQALHLVRALRDQLHEMTHELVRLERQDATGMNGRASAIRCEAAAPRRDINEAQILIDRLQLLASGLSTCKVHCPTTHRPIPDQKYKSRQARRNSYDLHHDCDTISVMARPGYATEGTKVKKLFAAGAAHLALQR
jgi:hypothetical protein